VDKPFLKIDDNQGSLWIERCKGISSVFNEAREQVDGGSKPSCSWRRASSGLLL